SETFSVNRFSLGAPPGPCGPPPGPPGPATRFAPSPPPAPTTPTVGPAAAGLAAAALPRLIVPKANARLIRRFTTTDAGEFPKFRGIITSPGSGWRLKFPKRVHLM